MKALIIASGSAFHQNQPPVTRATTYPLFLFLSLSLSRVSSELTAVSSSGGYGILNPLLSLSVSLRIRRILLRRIQHPPSSVRVCVTRNGKRSSEPIRVTSQSESLANPSHEPVRVTANATVDCQSRSPCRNLSQ